MDINSIINKVAIRIPALEKIIYQIAFEHIQSCNEVAFMQGKTIFYTDRLFLDYSDEEQAFVIAHEVMHYLFHQKNKLMDLSKYDEDLVNFVEDAQINQLLIKLGFIAPEGVVLLEDAMNYEFEDLYDKLLPMKREFLSDNNWSKYTNVTDILNNNQELKK